MTSEIEADTELPVVLLGPDRVLPAGQFFDDPDMAARVAAAAQTGRWRAAADGTSALLDLVDQGGSRVLMLVAACSPLAGVRAAAADLAGTGVFPFFADPQVDSIPDAEFFDIAVTLGVPVLVDTWEQPLVERMVVAAGTVGA